MSGNIWMYSHQIDDEDLEMLKRDFITYKMGVEYYGFGMKPFTRLVHEAGAVFKIGKMVRINRHIFESYLMSEEGQYIIEETGYVGIGTESLE